VVHPIGIFPVQTVSCPGSARVSGERGVGDNGVQVSEVMLTILTMLGEGTRSNFHQFCCWGVVEESGRKGR
jgi:hypothetical protein